MFVKQFTMGGVGGGGDGGDVPLKQVHITPICAPLLQLGIPSSLKWTTGVSLEHVTGSQFCIMMLEKGVMN